MLGEFDARPARCPCVSIILPTYDRLKFLPATIESVRQQTFEDWELLIADDGSGPELHAYLTSLHDPPKTKVLWLNHSGNPPAVRNVALHEATGDYVAFIDSDDVWLPQKLQLQVDSLRLHPRCHWSYTGFILIDEAGDPLSGTRAVSNPVIEGRLLDQLLRMELPIAPSSVLVRRSLLIKVGGFDPGLPVCGDYELWTRLAQDREIDHINQPLTHIRRHHDHYADDVTALEDLARTVEKLQRSNSAPHLDWVLKKRRAVVSSKLVRRHAICRNRSAVLGKLLSDVRFSWRYWSWWLAALVSIARVFTPVAVLDMIRAHRRKSPC